MPDTLEIKRLDQRPMTESLLAKNKMRFLGLDSDQVIKYFFSGSAWTAIIVLFLITVSLFREGYGFFPQHHESLKLYRLAGLEFVDIFRDQMTAQATLTRYLNELKLKQLEVFKKQGMSQEEAQQAVASFEKLRVDFDQAGAEGQVLLDEMTQFAAGVKDRYVISTENQTSINQIKAAGMEADPEEYPVENIDFTAEAKTLKSNYLTRHEDVMNNMAARLKEIVAQLPETKDKDIADDLVTFKATVEKFVSKFPEAHQKMVDWTESKPVPFYHSLTKFLTGSKWVTQSFWQDWYGVIPLFVGSLAVSIVALCIAVPLGVGAAIYINQVATPAEQNFIKPFIEFIAVIPSVVLGFFGIAVLGETLRGISNGYLFTAELINWFPGFIQWLPQGINVVVAFIASYIPGFPFSERLNILTCGILLALMSIPAIFTFSEDALNNVPKAYKEASFALGANRLQTIVRILVPASLSGIISAVLLGFGRVIGETMVVLLCAGNRIQIPDFTAGLNAIFQPVHTMTGIVAQEIPEVVNGSLQYRALFLLAICLFLISLLINYVAQIFVRKYKISVG